MLFCGLLYGSLAEPPRPLTVSAFITFLPFSSTELRLDTNDSFHSFCSPPSGTVLMANGKIPTTLGLFPKPSMAKYFNVVVTMASNPSNFIVSRLPSMQTPLD